MSQIEVFNNEQFGSIRVIEENGKYLFCGLDAAKALGYKDTVNALKAHCSKDGVAFYHLTDNLGRKQKVKFISEGNLYRLIVYSKLPSAERFERWVFDEVLPSIRKHGAYARWAKVFNLKQMAQTMNFLTEHNLLEYAVLEEKAAAATAHHNELSAQIKAAEKRMAEIAVLRTHIINYAKTREIYVAYRQAGYSKKFRQEHEAEILLHQAAKNAFDDMGVKKLPKVKELQTDYAKLLEEKKKIYAEYRRSREEMRELLTAKANVDRLLKMDEEQKQEKEKDHDQR